MQASRVVPDGPVPSLMHRGDGLPTSKQGKKTRRGGNPARRLISDSHRILIMTAAVRQALRPDQASRCARGRQDRAAYGGGLRPALTAAARSAFQSFRPGRRNRAPVELRNCKRGLRVEHLRLAMWLCDRTADQIASAFAAGHKLDQAIYPPHFGAHGRASDRVGVGRRSGFCFWGRAE